MGRQGLLLRVVLVGAFLSAAGDEAGPCVREPLFWLHVHNAGGTSVRALAEANGEAPLRPASTNWNLDPGDWGGCARRMELFGQQPLASMTFIERPIEAEDLGCAGLRYGLTIRHPVELMLSTLKNNVVDADTVRATLVRASALKLPPAGVELQHQGLLHETSPLGHFDNFLVRTLNGEAVFSGVPVGALTRKHVDHAIHVLRDHFDVVLKMGGGADFSFGPAAAFRGWLDTGASTDDRRGNKHEEKKADDAALLAVLKKHSALDLEVFDAVAPRGAAPPRCLKAGTQARGPNEAGRLLALEDDTARGRPAPPRPDRDVARRQGHQRWPESQGVPRQIQGRPGPRLHPRRSRPVAHQHQ